ncbi:DEAD/DEAH box helicase [Streptomyces sp. RFCAC02]|uniref:DEAD/DEAH box helicase n=1 Tax=Streptomyces sp. RFCAC02 TaxID=2499143 RepID=UPI00101FB9EA|nr:DEAD/DEAH box helicase [Streptomyces sp. RFCAC02]
MHRTAHTDDGTNRTGADAGRGRRRPSRRGRGATRPAGEQQRPPAVREQAAPRSAAAAPPPAETFDGLGLPAPLAATLRAEGLTAPFPIQAATLPSALAGRDVLGRGRTGSGKTLAFGLPLLARIEGRRAEPRRPLALVLVPTRELAQQVTDALTPYARALRLRLTTVVGGVGIGRQANALRAGAEAVIATPGRLADLIDRGDCRLDEVAVTVLDEADQMTDMGFLPQVTRLLDRVRPDGQRMLFSATLDKNVDRLVRRYLSDPVVHSVDPPAGAVVTMEHHLLYVQDTDKQATVTEIGARDGRVIMFLATKRAVDRQVKRLLAVGVQASALHGGKSQSQRTRTLDQFRTGHTTVLVATNVAARGIHIDNLDLVVNVDPPGDPKDYLHRGGRTARAGESGTVVTLVLPDQRRETNRMLAGAGIRAQVTEVRPGGAELSRITGARQPSGVPVVPVTTAAPAAAAPARATAAGTPGRARRNRPGRGRRTTARRAA